MLHELPAKQCLVVGALCFGCTWPLRMSQLQVGLVSLCWLNMGSAAGLLLVVLQITLLQQDPSGQWLADSRLPWLVHYDWDTQVRPGPVGRPSLLL